MGNKSTKGNINLENNKFAARGLFEILPDGIFSLYYSLFNLEIFYFYIIRDRHQNIESIESEGYSLFRKNE